MHDVQESGVDSRQKSSCIHCGGWIAGIEISQDHVPSKGLLLELYPPHLPTVAVCRACNEGFARDEEDLIGFLGSVLAGSADPDRQSNPSAERILRRSAKLRAWIERAKTEDQTLFGEKRLLWKPETERVNRVILKNARGHAYFEYGEPMLESPTHVSAVPLEALTPEQRARFRDRRLRQCCRNSAAACCGVC